MRFLVILILYAPFSFAQQRAKTNAAEEFVAYPVNIAHQLEIFQNNIPGATYRISLCADVPNNKKPLQVAHQQESGHVFLVLQKMHDGDTISQVFGFYPKRGLPVLFVKTIASRVKDNSKREYDVEVSKNLTAAEFDTACYRAVFYSKKKYHINKFNCYDYAIEIFNAVAGPEPIPVKRVRFPFVFGWGGSPCSVYGELKKLKESDSVWKPYIRFGNLVAPVSTGRTSARAE